MPKLRKGEHTPLNVTQEAHHRIFVGLGWDPKKKEGLMDKVDALIHGKDTRHDLDLSCFIYNEQKELLDSVAAAQGRYADATGKIYHSGDNVEGFGEGDDEQISVELKNLSPDIHHLLFKVSIKSGHVFRDIQAPEIRLTDAYSNHDFLKVPLNHKEGQNKAAYIFAHIYRNESAWNLHFVGQYFEKPDIHALIQNLNTLPA